MKSSKSFFVEVCVEKKSGQRKGRLEIRYTDPCELDSSN